MRLTSAEIQDYLIALQDELASPANFKTITLTRDWAALAPEKPGVYVLKYNDQIVYVGETGSLRGRMYDLLNTVNHTVRRSIGERYFSKVGGFIKATSSQRFPEHVEVLVNDFIGSNLKISYLPVPLGRKELEELIADTINPEIKLNKRGRRANS